MVGRRSGCAFRWESGKLRYAMKHHFLAWMEVAIISFLGLRSPLPRIVILPVQVPLGRSPLLPCKRLNKKAHADFTVANTRLSACAFVSGSTVRLGQDRLDIVWFCS